MAGCKPAAYATRETDLLREPPPLLPSEANAFWNDRAAGSYGELTLGAIWYRRDDALCRTARVTSIDTSTRASRDRTLLYCAKAGGPFELDPALSCRALPTGLDVTCRDVMGDDVVLHQR
jgi:hypothetical protein